MSSTDELVWPIEEREVRENYRIFTVRQHRAANPFTGAKRLFTVLECDDWVNVVAITPDKRVIFVKQFRHGVEHVTLEIPGGLVDPGEHPSDAAVRELREESGYAGKTCQLIGVVEPNPATQTNRCWTYLIEDAERVGELELDDGEAISVETVPLWEVSELIRRGEITHALVVAAFAHYMFKNGATL